MNRTTGDTMGSLTVSLKLCQLREQAREHPDWVFTTLHHLNENGVVRFVR
ncbi:MAG: hypothetical protein SCABRO_00508 [Candidatus Scalindua brodae]|uniref:Uncharacterized protein n=1 Tax=Candidatus Scalindua brodae TaxID=237368 RepID=A0A0B0ESR9_9BACT|nr:MAG: hypothetical protein SCABRO_00508 [Candidatus Scalindua brodae]